MYQKKFKLKSCDSKYNYSEIIIFFYHFLVIEIIHSIWPVDEITFNIGFSIKICF